ncbi:MAG: redoxin domain-containing protein [Methylotenera sp.]|nr:redoxin domain-containing protein [Oligoflexia bacterium]
MRVQAPAFQIAVAGVILWAFSSAGPATALAAVPTQVSGADVLTGRTIETRTTDSQKGTVVVFLSANCPCSASHEIVLKTLFKEYSSQGFRFIGVHSNTDESSTAEAIERTRSHFTESALPFPIIQDVSAKIANDWSALKTPHVFVVNPQGELLYQGGVDDSHSSADAKKKYLKEALSAIQSGKKPEVALTRSLGCAIKRN